MPHRLFKLHEGRALPALFILFLLPVLFSCTQDKGAQERVAPAPTAVAESAPAGVPVELAPEPVKLEIEVSSGPASEASEALARGDLDRADALLREAAKGISADEAERALAVVLAKKAEKDIESGDFQTAIARLQEASGLSNEAGILSLLAKAQYRSGDLASAAATLEKLPHEPGNLERLKAVYIMLGKKMREAGDMNGAALFFGKAARLDPEDAALSEALASAEREDSFEAGMGRREGGHFLVKFEGGENAEAGHLIGLLLEEAYLKVGSDLGHHPDKRIEALLYSKEAFRDITRSPSWAGAIYDGRIKLPAGGITAKTSALEKVIFHEYTHAVVRELSKGRAPVWLNEGLAQYEEGQSSAPYERTLSALASKSALKLRPLEGSFMGLDAREAQMAYVLSLSATEYVIREFGLFSVRAILERLGEGMGLDEAISASLGVSYEELEKDWRSALLSR